MAGLSVLFIGGTGRTGSTFLSQLLSQNADAMNVGQIRDFPNAYRRARDCSCGHDLESCAYWSEVAAAPGVADALRRMNEGRRQFRIGIRGQKHWDDADWRKRMAEDHADYLADLAALYGAAADAAGGRTLIDSSKSSEIALSLTFVPGIKLRILNLVRDPRAVAISWLKRKPGEETIESAASQWLKRQEQFDKMQALQPAVPFRRLRYEDLTAKPRETVESILRWAGLDPSTANFSADDAASISWADQHLFPPSNEEVLKARATSITIRPANSWKAEASREARKSAEAVSFPDAERYGYSRTAD